MINYRGFLVSALTAAIVFTMACSGDDNDKTGAPTDSSQPPAQPSVVNTDLCKSLAASIGGPADRWSQATNNGQPINACKLSGSTDSGFRGWEVKLLPGTVNHIWIWIQGGNNANVTAVGPAEIKGTFLVAEMTVYYDQHLDRFRGQWTLGNLSAADSGEGNHWVPIGTMPTSMIKPPGSIHAASNN